MRFLSAIYSKDKKTYISFIFAFIIMCIYIIPMKDMISKSGDAQSIWNAIITFDTNNQESSYVMYKGFLSIYPYVWFYRFSNIFGVDHFLFIKIYHATLFAYITAVGFPALISSVIKVKMNICRRLVFVLLCFYMWEYTQALSQLMIDLPSLAVFILMVNTVIKISDKNIKKQKSIWLYAGILIGMGFCFSGQYTFATFIILMYFFSRILFHESRLCIKKYIVLLIILFIGVSIPMSYNVYFENTVLKAFRDRGDWLPDGGTWAKYGLTRDLNKYDMASIKSNRGEAIIRDYEGSNYDNIEKLIDSGQFQYEYNEYIKIIMRHPIDFIIGCFNRLFLALSFDSGRQSVISLFISFTSVFISYIIIKKRVILYKDIFKRELIISFAFLAIVLPLCVIHVENRYAIGMNGYLMSILVFNDRINMEKRSLLRWVNDISIKNIFEKSINNIVIIYWIFMLFCYMHFGVIYELIGSDPSRILYTW